MVIVTKFGGSSVKDVESIDRVIEILFQNPRRRIAVVSAPAGLTDKLIGFAQDDYAASDADYERQVSDVRNVFHPALGYFGLESSLLDGLYQEFDRALRSREGKTSEEYQDSVAVFGEILNAAVISQAIRKKGKASEVVTANNMGMYTDDNFGNGKLNEVSMALIKDYFINALKTKKNIFFIVPGYYGINIGKKPVTFGRDGSNYVAAVIAAAIKAELYENFSDQKGICRANPKSVPEAQDDIIPELSFWEARELAYSGSKILHPATIVPLAKAGIPLRVRSTFDTKHEGTLIHSNGTAYIGIKGIAEKTMYKLRIEKMGMDDIHGYMKRMDDIFDELKVDIHQPAASVDSLAYTFTLPQNGDGEKTLRLLEDKIKQDKTLSPDIYEISESTVICVVGEGIGSQVGLAAKLQVALQKAQINLRGIAHGPSSRSIIYEVPPESAKLAVSTLYQEAKNINTVVRAR